MNMRTKLINNLSKALWDSDLVATRIVLSLSEMFWAVMLLWPGIRSLGLLML